jgi:hypothetical protein
VALQLTGSEARCVLLAFADLIRCRSIWPLVLLTSAWGA